MCLPTILFYYYTIACPLQAANPSNTAYYIIHHIAFLYLLRVGWRNFFSGCAVVSVFWFWWEIGFGVTYLRT
jgi:hypothetical protein